MKYYISTTPTTLAEKLKEKGMSMNLWEGAGEYMEQLEDIVEMRDGFYLGTFKNTILYQLPTYAEVFDWLMEKEIFITLPPIGKLEDGSYRYEATITYDDATDEEYLGGYTWYEAANAAVEKALTLI